MSTGVDGVTSPHSIHRCDNQRNLWLIIYFKAGSAKAVGEVRVTTTEVVTTATTTSSQRTLQIVDGAVQSVKVSESKATLLNTHKSVVATHPSRYAGVINSKERIMYNCM